MANISVSRQLDRPIGKALRKEVGNAVGRLHMSHNWTMHGVGLQQYWDPYADTDLNIDTVHFGEQLQLIRNDRERSIPSRKAPVFSMIGIGAWFAVPHWVETDCNNSTEEAVKFFEDRLVNISEAIGPDANDFITAPMDPHEGVGNRVFFVPPAGPYYTGTEVEYIIERAQAVKNVHALQNWLGNQTDHDFNFDQAWSFFNLVDGHEGTIVDPTWTGWHVTEPVAETKANILLNMRCNAKLDRLKGYPYARTCCTDYGNKPVAQLGLVTLGIIYLVICVMFDGADLIMRPKNPLWGWRIFSMKPGAFAMAVLLCYYADRTHLFAKGEKNWLYQDFLLFCAPFLLAAIISVRKSLPVATKTLSLDKTADKDQPFLSRDQTEEWKGWMQVAILVYHWTAAAESFSIYVMIRVLVAAYLFQTGYGHTTFFLKKGDFSFKRFAAVLLRLNLLPCTLAYVMNTDYMFYYFSPLCSFWFIVVYLTMAIGHKYNDDTQVLLAKICISAVTVTFVIRGASLFQWIFLLLKYGFNIHWSISEWEYRVTLDSIIVYVGMLMAIAYMKLEDDVRGFLRYTMALAGVVAMIGYWYTSSEMSVDQYRARHPYFSFVPILAFIAIRNMSGPARNYYSTAMAWLGRCSLETYTLQFHIFLAADTYGVLLIEAFVGDETILHDRWKSLVFIVPMFLWVSSLTAKATTALVEIILTSPSFDYQRVEPMKDEQDLESRTDDVDEKEEDTETNDDSSSDDPRAGLLVPSRSIAARCAPWLQKMQSFVFSVHLRIILLLAIMVALNLFYPVPDNHIPNGFTMEHIPQ